jgi:hypothetical protein
MYLDLRSKLKSVTEVVSFAISIALSWEVRRFCAHSL